MYMTDPAVWQIINNARKLMVADGYTELAVWDGNKYFEDYLSW